jgi:hypothetical protein
MWRRIAIVLVLALASLAMAGVALAGGWAVITLDSLPGASVQAGETISLGFMVRQHGETPVHFVEFMGNEPVRPVLTAVNQATGEKIRAEAIPDKTLGHFTVEFALPSEGEWSWSISPSPLEGTLELEPLTATAAAVTVPQVQAVSAAPVVAAAAAAPALDADPGMASALRSGGLVLAAAAGVMIVLGLIGRRRQTAAQVSK